MSGRRTSSFLGGRREHARWLGVHQPSGGAPPPGPSLPIDWSTDLLFARASAATHFAAPTLTRYASGAARVLGDGSLYVEGSRTNRLDNSSTFVVVTGCTVALNTGVDPSGGSDSAQITITGNGGRAETVGPTTSTVDTIASLFVETVSGNTSWNMIYPASTAFTAPATWGRVTAYLGSATGAASRTVRVQEAGPANDNVMLVFGAQVEWGSRFPSQLIETSGATATRLADDAVIEDADVPAAMRSGAWEITIKPRRASTETNDTTTDTLFAFGAGLDNRVFINASNQIVVRESGADEVTTGALTWSADQAITLTFDAAAGTVVVAGATTGNGTTTGTAWTMPSGDVQVGNDAALGTAFFGSISPPEAP